MDSNVRAGSSPAPSTEKNLNNLFIRKLRFSCFRLGTTIGTVFIKEISLLCFFINSYVKSTFILYS